MSVRAAAVEIIKRAERNKVFREGWHGALRFVAIDGWEPYSSRLRCCAACLTRQVTVGEGKNKQRVTEYYHRYVVALLLDEQLELVLDMKPVRSADVRRERGECNVPGGRAPAAWAPRRHLRGASAPPAPPPAASPPPRPAPETPPRPAG